MKAIKIKMKRNCGNSGNVQDIDSIYIDQTSTYWKKSEVYDYRNTSGHSHQKMCVFY